MFPTKWSDPYAVPVLAALSLLTALIIFLLFRRALLARFGIMAKHSPKFVLDLCVFCKAVVHIRLSNLLISGVIGLYWFAYTQIEGRNPSMNVFWGLVVALFVFACFGAWREQYLEVEKQKEKRPDFQYDPNGSTISFKTDAGNTLKADFGLSFKNKGNGIAYNPSSTGYGCWVTENVAESVFPIHVSSSVGRTDPEGRIRRQFEAWHFVDVVNGVPQIERHFLVLLFEINARRNSRDGELHRSEPIWLAWHPPHPESMSWPNEDEVELVEWHIDRFKQRQISPEVTPPA